MPCTHAIEVLCYPSHSTHAYQGLDVVDFQCGQTRVGVNARDEYERRTCQKVTKSNFLEIYSIAHVVALTLENIKAAFKKTGVVPLNPNIVSKEMMAPSLEMSTENTIALTAV